MTRGAEPAFPCVNNKVRNKGLSTLLEIAKFAMHGLLAGRKKEDDVDIEELVHNSFIISKAMLQEEKRLLDEQ
jgi:hypothetical protein